MRRLFVYLVALGFFGTIMVGCCHCHEPHVRGVYDAYQLTPCSTRQPWVEQMSFPVEVKDAPKLESKKL